MTLGLFLAKKSNKKTNYVGAAVDGKTMLNPYLDNRSCWKTKNKLC